MTYLIAQLWLFLLIAGLIGSILGWILRGGCKRHIKTLKALQEKYVKLEKENTLNKDKQKQITSLFQDKSAVLTKQLKNNKQHNMKLTARLLAVNEAAKKSQKIYGQAGTRLKKTEQMLTFAKQSNLAKDTKIKQLQEECRSTENLLMTCENDWEAKNQDLQTKIGELQGAIDASQNKQVDIHSRLTEKEAIVAKLIAQLDQAEQAKSELEREKEEITQAKGEVEREKEEIKQAMGVVEQEKLEVTKVADTLGQSIEEAEQGKNQAFADLELFKEQAQGFIKGITAENISYGETVDRLEADIQDGKKKLMEQEDVIERMQAELNDKDNVIDGLKAKASAYRSTTGVGADAVRGDGIGVTSDDLSLYPRSGNVSRWKRIKNFSKRRRS